LPKGGTGDDKQDRNTGQLGFRLGLNGDNHRFSARTAPDKTKGTKGDERGQPPYYEADKARHDKMVSLVVRMLNLHKDLPKARTAPDKTAIERQIEGEGITDRTSLRD
jgi:hypothetical protein